MDLSLQIRVFFINNRVLGGFGQSLNWILFSKGPELDPFLVYFSDFFVQRNILPPGSLINPIKLQTFPWISILLRGFLVYFIIT